MKKQKTKSKSSSATKKARKELETRLSIAFNEVLAQFGKAKKTDKVIEKFAKQLSKKISLVPANDTIDPFIKEENNTDVENQSEVISETKKAPAKKAKAEKVVS